MPGENTGYHLYESSELARVIPDPGDGGNIAVAQDLATVELVTTGAETRTLVDPAQANVEVTLVMKTDGGDCVVTASTAVNATGNNTLTFGAVTDIIVLKSVHDGSGGYAWRVIGNDGVALSTV